MELSADSKISTVYCMIMLIPENWKKNMRVSAMRKGLRTELATKSRTATWCFSRRRLEDL